LPNLRDLRATAPAAGADQDAIPALAPHPELQRPRLFVDLVPVHAVPRPVQNLGEFSFGQPAILAHPFTFLRRADNGNPLSHEDFKGDRRKVFNGLCLAIVQSMAKPGQIQITATSPGLRSGSVTITTSA
jgi:hypothetical protein